MRRHRPFPLGLPGAVLLHYPSVMHLATRGALTPDPLDATFAALADPFAMTQPAISKHLKVLKRAGLVTRGRDAQRRPRRLQAKPLAEATEWLAEYRRFGEGSFRNLDALLEELRAREKHRGRPKR